MLTKSDYDVTFVTRNQKKISHLQQRNEYPVNIANQQKDRIIVRNVTAISSKNQLAVAQKITQVDLITTAVGVSNLSDIAAKIALGIRLRLQANNRKPLHIIACENATNSSVKLKKHIFEHLPPILHDKALTLIAFPNTVVDRIVPVPDHDDPLEVTVEPYYEWIIDRSAMLEGLPPIKGVQLVDSLEAFIERKLFTVNTGHCCIAYFGYLNGYSTIQESMTDPQLISKVHRVMLEIGKMLIQKHDFDEQEHRHYIHKTIKRFTNPYFSDEIVRVGRSPIRKLAKNDRLVQPTLQTFNLGLDVSNLTNVIAAALLFDHDEDPEAAELTNAIRKSTIHQVITNYLGIPRSHPIHQKVVTKYLELKRKKMQQLIST
ncbi:mannitol-1-phosphate 5-dehydrogenase [Lysinibacillus macroides]|uniref:Mannitol-1-phosphate 5-dehydrogenase n=2 Tax=Lysinibacillus macroides TaxID=33935 RepID=A0A0N1J050_9BACI|nr:mannitol-1-phosphate 5-dehydrogenase [Lysinibacillus macroides]